MTDKPEKISIEEAKAKAESIASDVKDWIEDAAEDGMVFVEHFFGKIKDIFNNFDWKQHPYWLDEDDEDPDDSMGT